MEMTLFLQKLGNLIIISKIKAGKSLTTSIQRPQNHQRPTLEACIGATQIARFCAEKRSAWRSTVADCQKDRRSVRGHFLKNLFVS